MAYFLPDPTIARLSRGAFLDALEDSGGVLVAAAGGGVGMAEAGHQLALGGAGPSGEGASRVAKVVEVQFVVSHLVPSPTPVLVEGRGREQATTLDREEERVLVLADAVEVLGKRVEDELGESNYSPASLGLGLGQETAPAVEEDYRAPSRGDRVRQFENQLRPNDRAFDGALHSGASHPARIGLDEIIGPRSGPDRERGW